MTAYDNECFFITPIGEDDTPERKRADGVMKVVVEPAAAEHGLSVVRADEMAEPGTITAQIVEHIVGAKVVVADLTGENANVFYELAVRDAAQLPAVMIAQDGTNLPFDKAQDRTIFFDSLDLESSWKAKEKLARFMKAALDGKMGNPVANAMVWKEYAGSGKPVEQAVAGLAEQVSAISVEIQGLRRDLQLRVQRSAASAEPSNPLIRATVTRVHAAADMDEKVEIVEPALLDRISELREQGQTTLKWRELVAPFPSGGGVRNALKNAFRQLRQSGEINCTVDPEPGPTEGFGGERVIRLEP